jgi:hypothetical protein
MAASLDQQTDGSLERLTSELTPMISAAFEMAELMSSGH